MTYCQASWMWWSTMESDHFTVLDFILLMLLSALVWFLNFLSNPENKKKKN